jgi:hypothetical protein
VGSYDEVMVVAVADAGGLAAELEAGVLVTRVGRFVLALVTVVLLVGLLIGFPMARQFGARS